jgi:hypothetical protein
MATSGVDGFCRLYTGPEAMVPSHADAPRHVVHRMCQTDKFLPGSDEMVQLEKPD